MWRSWKRTELKSVCEFTEERCLKPQHTDKLTQRGLTLFINYSGTEAPGLYALYSFCTQKANADVCNMFTVKCNTDAKLKLLCSQKPIYNLIHKSILYFSINFYTKQCISCATWTIENATIYFQPLPRRDILRPYKSLETHRSLSCDSTSCSNRMFGRDI